MAKLSAHGQEIGRIRYTTHTLAFFPDGKILRNYGQGWKLYRKCKPDKNPVDVYNRCVEKQQQAFAERPAFAAYRKILDSLTGMKTAWKVHEAVKVMPQDPDGVWSETCDGYGENCSASLDEVIELCKAWEAVEEEAKILQPIEA